jgi:hypothetical protein
MVWIIYILRCVVVAHISRNHRKLAVAVLICMAVAAVIQCQLHVPVGHSASSTSDRQDHTDSGHSALHSVCVVAVLPVSTILAFLLVTLFNPSLWVLEV